MPEVTYKVEGCFSVLNQTKGRHLEQSETLKSLSLAREPDVLDQKEPWDWGEVLLPRAH